MSTEIPVASETAKPPRRGRWIPISARIFLASLVALLGCSAWVAIPIYRQRAAVQKIRALDGWVERRPTEAGWLQQFGPSWLAEQFIEVEGIDFEFARSPITDSDLSWIGDCRSLRKLDVNFQPVTDVGLAHLRKLPDLRILNLTGTSITDAGVEHLKNLKALQILHLSGTRVTDRGIVRLKTMTNLQTLTVARTSVTDAGKAELQQALPRLEIDKDERFHPIE